MSKQTQASAQPKAQPARLILDVAQINAFAKATANAFAQDEALRAKASQTLMERVAKAVAHIGKPITASQYDTRLSGVVAKAFAAKVEAGAMTEGTASKTRSQVKTATLAILSNAATPEPGEGFKAFVSRAAEVMANAKLADGTPVWASKVGRKAKVGKAQARKGGASGAPTGSPQGAPERTAPTGRSPEIAAAMILCKDNATRAAKLVKVLESFASEFDKWASAILADSAKADASEDAAKQAA